MFLLLERRFFVVECRKTHFHGLYCLKKVVGKMAIFLTKTKKMSIFGLFELDVFIARKAFFRCRMS